MLAKRVGVHGWAARASSHNVSAPLVGLAADGRPPAAYARRGHARGLPLTGAYLVDVCIVALQLSVQLSIRIW
jgi:hypothetical protein